MGGWVDARLSTCLIEWRSIICTYSWIEGAIYTLDLYPSSEPIACLLVQEWPLYQHDQHNDTVLIGPDHNHACYKDRCCFRYSTGRGTVKITEMRKKVTVVTLFITSDDTTDGNLTEIRRFWAQDGVGCEGLEFRCPDRNLPHVRILRRADDAFWE